MNHPAGPFVYPYCSASRKGAHESARGYFTRCSHIYWIRSTTVRARACVWNGEGGRDSGLHYRGCHICCSPCYLLWIKADCAPLTDYCLVVLVCAIVTVVLNLEAATVSREVSSLSLFRQIFFPTDEDSKLMYDTTLAFLKGNLHFIWWMLFFLFVVFCLLLCSLDNVRHLFGTFLFFPCNCQWNMLFSPPFSVPLLCYAGLRAVGAQQ